MATTFEELSLKGIRAADLQVLHNLIIDKQEDCRYYGHREQYYARLDRLEKWIGQAVDYAYSEGVKMPKANK